MSPVRFLGIALVAVVASSVQAQVDLIWTNVSSVVPASYHDCVVILPAGGVQRPLAQETTAGSGVSSTAPLNTGSVINRPFHRQINGRNYLYFFDNIVDRLFRGWDENANSVIDPIEFEPLWDISATGNISPDSVQFHNGRIVLSNDAGSGTRGVWLLEDLDGNGDYYGVGEATQIVNGGSAGSTMLVQGVVVSSDDIDGAALLGNGDVIFYEDDDEIIYRWDSTTGTINTWLRYQSLGATAALPGNADFGTILPPVSGDMDRITVHHAATPEIIYLAVDFNSSEPLVFTAQDFNADGDVNDSGEVGLFYDGSVAPTPTGATDDIYWFQGSLFLSHEDSASSGSFIQLTDTDGNGQAMGVGEQTVLATLPPGDDPTMLGFLVVPAGTFGSNSCVAFDMVDTGISSAGNVLSFTLKDIPLSSQGVGLQGFVAASGTGGGNVTIAPGCVAGFTFDALTTWQFTNAAAAFLTGPVGGSTATTPGFSVGPGAPVGLELFFTAALFDASGLVTAVSQSRSITVN